MVSLELRLLGTFEAEIDGRAVRGWSHRRATELVKVLALADRHRLHREQAIDALWPDLNAEAGAANLRKAVHYARRTFGTDVAIGSEPEWIELGPHHDVRVDVEEFERRGRAALSKGDPAACASAAALWTGELLPDDRYAPWAEAARERVRLLAQQLFRAAGWWERALQLDPVDEESHRALMQAALNAGDRGAAIRQFERLRERLRTDLGLGPDRASVALFEKALAMEGHEPPSPAEQVRADLAWGLVHLNAGEFEEAERTAERARSLAIDAELGREMGEASALLGIVANMQGRWKEVFREEFLASVSRAPDMASYVFDAHLCLAEFCLCGPTPYEEIVGYASDLLHIAEGADSIQGRALAHLLLGEADLFSDRIEEAESHLNASVHLHRRADSASGEAISLQRLAETAVARGERNEARDMLEQGLRLSETNYLAPHLMVRILGGMVEAAAPGTESVEEVERADEVLSGLDVCRPCSMGFRIEAAMTLARAGSIDQARARLAEAERFAGMWSGGPWQAAVWEGRGVLRQAQGDNDQAAAFFKEAAEGFTETGRPRAAARCLAAAGAVMAQATPTLSQSRSNVHSRTPRS